MEDIFLNVYNLSTANYCFGSCGLGTYHSTVEIYGKEYSFGVNLGISILPKGTLNLELYEKILVGKCNRTDDSILYIIEQLKNKYNKSKYHYLLFNCNNFTNELLNILCKYDIPDYINRIPRSLANFSCLKNTNRYMCNLNNFTKVPIKEHPINKEETDNFIEDFEFIDIEANYTSKKQ